MVKKGRAKRKQYKIESGSVSKIDKYYKIAEEFFPKIFNMDLENVLITDESTVYDFCSFGNSIKDLNRYTKLIKREYGIDISQNTKLNLTDIFENINTCRE